MYLENINIMTKAVAEESSSDGCDMCGTGDSTCEVSCDGGETWETCDDVKGIEVVD
jgi:hypothetical protein